MAQLNITLDDGFLKALMLGDREKGYDDAMRHLLEQVFNPVLSAEAAEQVGAGLYERNEDRLTYRNGYRTRGLTTRVGSLMLHIPKLRDGTFSTALFRRYERSEQALLLSMMEMVIQGVSRVRSAQSHKLYAGCHSQRVQCLRYVRNSIPSLKASSIVRWHATTPFSWWTPSTCAHGRGEPFVRRRC